jgi:hypothetical protein
LQSGLGHNLNDKQVQARGGVIIAGLTGFIACTSFSSALLYLLSRLAPPIISD